MPVAELLERMSMEELASWAAYEEACGPVDNSRIEELLSSIHEQIQLSNWMYAEVKMSGEDSDGNLVMNWLGEKPTPVYIGVVDRKRDDWRHVGMGEVLSGDVDVRSYERLFDPIDDPDLEDFHDEYEDAYHD